MTQSLENHLMAPLPSGSKSEVIIQRITEALISGDLRPGDKIPTEQEFCDQLKIGRNTVREAIKVLIAFGVLEIRRSEGTFVVDHFSPKLMDSVLYGLILCPRSLDSLLEFKILVVDVHDPSGHRQGLRRGCGPAAAALRRPGQDHPCAGARCGRHLFRFRGFPPLPGRDHPQPPHVPAQ